MIRCPSGLAGTIRGLEVREERLLAERPPAHVRAALERRLLHACWLETIDPGPYVADRRSIDWELVEPRDRRRVLLGIYERTYGPIVAIAAVCIESVCRARFRCEVDLRELPVARPDDAARFDTECPDCLARQRVRLPFAEPGAAEEGLFPKLDLHAWRESLFQLCWSPGAGRGLGITIGEALELSPADRDWLLDRVDEQRTREAELERGSGPPSSARARIPSTLPPALTAHPPTPGDRVPGRALERLGDVVPEPLPVDDGAISPLERFVLARVDGRRRVRDVAGLVELSVAEVAAVLMSLGKRAAVRLPEDGPRRTTSGVRPRVRAEAVVTLAGDDLEELVETPIPTPARGERSGPVPRIAHAASAIPRNVVALRPQLRQTLPTASRSRLHEP